MNKLKGFILALTLCILSTIIGGYSVLNLVDQKLCSLPNSFVHGYSSKDRLKMPELLSKSIDDGTMILMGSSELLSDSDKPGYPGRVINTRDFNLMFIGQGGYQSIIQAGILGAIGSDLSSKKVALIVSPQWFTSLGIAREAIPANLSINTIDALLKNEKLSKETKELFLKRVLDLTEDFDYYHEKVSRLRESKTAFSPITKIISSYDLFKSEIGLKLRLWFNIRKIDNFGGYNEAPIDFSIDELLPQAERTAKTHSTNNDYYIEDEYYNLYIADRLTELKNSEVSLSYRHSPEYDDLKLYLKIANELEITPLLISIPVSGKWADYTGFSAVERQSYYETIRDLAASSGAKISDLSSHEYDPYFFKDVMHIGEKGWLYIDKALIEYGRIDQ